MSFGENVSLPNNQDAVSTQNQNFLNTLSQKEKQDLYERLKKELEITESQNNEPYEDILDPNTRQFTVFPIKYQGIWQLYKEQLACFWKAEEIDFSNDYDDYMTLSKNEQYFVEMILAFFAASDGIVNFNLGERFTREIQNNEVTIAYQFQTMMENIHCVSGDTQILTDNGYKMISDVLFQYVNVWNGKEFSKVFIQYTGRSPLYHVELSNGMYLNCTPEHKWFIRSGNQLHPERCKKEIIYTKDLKINDVIYNYKLPVVRKEDPDKFENPYIHGFFCGDGTYCNGYPVVDLYGEKKNLLEYFDIKKYQTNDLRFRFYITDKINKDKYFVPINYSLETKLRWLEGMCDSDGCVSYNSKKTGTAIQLSNNNKSFLEKIQLMLTTIGINTNIKIVQDERDCLLPDGKGGKKIYHCNTTYVLYITLSGVTKLYEMGFRPKRLQIMTSCDTIEKSKLIKIKNITKLTGDDHATYCFTEFKEHAGVFNGVLTGQSETYSLMLDNIIKNNPKKKELLFNAIQTIPSVKMMADWAFKWIESSKSFAHRVVAFAVVEGVFFSGAFAAIFWLKKNKNKNRDASKGKPFMDGLIKSNKFISRDEGLHVKFACEVYSLLQNKLSTNEINQIMDEGVKIAKNFMLDALPINLIGMNGDKMSDYIEYIGDRLLVMLGYKKIYNKQNPFKFMETIGLNDKTNFFETRPHEYQDANVMNKGNKSEIVISDDF